MKKSAPPPATDSLMLPRPSGTRGTALWAEIPVRDGGGGSFPLCPCVQLSWVSGQLSHELSKGPFPLSLTGQRALWPGALRHPLPPQVPSPPELPLHPSTPQRALDGSQPGVSVHVWATGRLGSVVNWGSVQTQSRLWRSWVAPAPDPDPEPSGRGNPTSRPRPQKGQAGFTSFSASLGPSGAG